MKQTILIDGFNLGLEKGTGIATYSRNLSYSIRDIGHSVDVLYPTRAKRSQLELLKEIAFFDQPKKIPLPWMLALAGSAYRVSMALTGLRATEIPIAGKVVAQQFRSRLPYFDRIWAIPDVFDTAHDLNYAFGRFLPVSAPQKIDIAHWTYPLPMFFRGAKNIYTLHDLIPLRLPYTSLDHKRRYYKMIKRILRKADHVVTVSETSKRDICNLFDFPENKVTNTFQSVEIPQRYAGKSEATTKNEVEGSFKIKYKEYFMFFGAIEPKKNVARLIESYLASNIKTPLVLVGNAAWKSDQELKLLNNDSIRYLEQIDNQILTRDRILRIDYAPFPLLVSLIKGAKGVLFPSLYEGFGLPVLESMKLGTPVMSSNTSSIPEVAGDAALLVDPYDTAAMANAILALDTNSELRGDLSAKGLKQSELYSDVRYRQRLTELYARL